MKCDGFTLLETLVAFTLLSVFTVLMINILVENRFRVEKLNLNLSLVEVSQNAIDRIKTDITSGRLRTVYNEKDSGFLWSANVTAVDRLTNSKGHLYLIKLSVKDKSGAEKLSVDTRYFPSQSL